jgi:hypothetical protein
MDLPTTRRAVPMVYGVVVVLVALFASDALPAVSIVGALLVGLFFVLSSRRVVASGVGRDRRRSRLR